MSKEAMKLALENICSAKLCEINSMSSRHEMIRLMDEAIKALREALAEQPPCKYPHCPYPCPDLPDCRDAEQPTQQVPVALFTWLPEGATHIGRMSVRTCSGGSLAMSTHAFKYENGVLRVYVTDNDNEYPGWRDAKDVFFHLNFPVLPLYTSPQSKSWVPLTEFDIDQIPYSCSHADSRLIAYAIEAKLRERNT